VASNLECSKKFFFEKQRGLGQKKQLANKEVAKRF
jgi:hypothetical protein